MGGGWLRMGGLGLRAIRRSTIASHRCAHHRAAAHLNAHGASPQRLVGYEADTCRSRGGCALRRAVPGPRTAVPRLRLLRLRLPEQHASWRSCTIANDA